MTTYNNPFTGSYIEVTKIIDQKKLPLDVISERINSDVSLSNEYYTLYENGVLVKHRLGDEPIYNMKRGM